MLRLGKYPIRLRSSVSRSTQFLEALGEAIGIVLVVSLLALGWRAGLVVALTIPLVLSATFFVMYADGD